MAAVTAPRAHPAADPVAAATRAAQRAAAMADTRPADLVLTGGAVYTVDAARTMAEAIAVRDDRIIAVGPAAVVRSRIGPRTRVVELRGRTVLPGFGDAHVHPTHGGLAMARCELHGLRGVEAYLDAVRAYATAHPEQAWIRGGGWHMDDFPGGNPTRDLLDRVVPDRPVYLPSRDGHSVWVNSRALELAGVSADTPDPRDGVIVREPDGRPAGTLHEGAAELVGRLVPADTPEDLEEGIRVGQRYLHSLGITQWQDAIVEPGDEAAYRALDGRGELTARVVGALWWERGQGAEQIEALAERRAAGPWNARFAATSVKIMQDGVLENFTGALLEPYLGADRRPTTNRGISMVEPEALRRHVTALDALGFQVHVHAIGDRAVREALDAFEAARDANGAGAGRHHISHIQVVHPGDVPRFRALGVAANMQPLWACHEGQMDNLTIPFLGPERAAHQYPFGALHRAGATLVAGSDWPVSTPNPLEEIEVAVERVYPTSRGVQPPFLPDERLALPDAVAAFTAGTAWINHLDDETGTLEPGRLADLAVLDRDLFDRGAGAIADARVVATFVDGRAVFEDGLEA